MPREYRYGRPSSRSGWEDERDYGRGRDEWRDQSREYRSRRDEEDWRDMNSSLDRQDRDYQGTLRAGDYGRYEEEQPYPPRFQGGSRNSDRNYGESDVGRRSGESRYGSERDYGGSSGYSYGGGGGSYGDDTYRGSNYSGARSRGYGSGSNTGYGGRPSNTGQSGGFGSYTQDYDRKYGSGRWSSGEYGRGGRDYGNREHDYGNRERGWFERATDEVSSWFGDDDAERRRRMDHHRGRGPKNYSRSDDRIREDVSDRLTDDPLVDASEIEVSVQNQEVTLTGTVSSRNERRLAEETVEGVSGVKYVQNNLRIRNRSGSNTFGGSSTTTV